MFLLGLAALVIIAMYAYIVKGVCPLLLLLISLGNRNNYSFIFFEIILLKRSVGIVFSSSQMLEKLAILLYFMQQICPYAGIS